MLENDTIIESPTEQGVIRPLIISDTDTVKRFYAPLRHLLFGFEAHDVSCRIVVPPGSRIESFLWPGIEIIEYPAWRFPLFYRQNRRRLVFEAEEFKPTIIHCLGAAKARLAKFLGRVFNIPVVLTVNSAQQNLLRRWAMRKGISAVITPSQRISELLSKQNPHIASLIKQVNIGTFVDETCACFSQPHRVASIVVVTDFLRFSDLEPFLNAIRHLAVDGYEFLAILVGSGSAENEIRRFIHSVGLVNTVSISPQISPLRVVFRGADIYVQPYITERFDPAITEAAGAGSAIAVDKDNIDNFLQNGSTTVFFDSHDELSIYSALQKLLDDKEFAKSIASAAQSYLRSNNSVSSMIEELLKIYSQASMQ